MMSEVSVPPGEDSNGESFEIVDKNTSSIQESPGAQLASLPAPSALPAFATLPPATTTAPAANPYSIRATATNPPTAAMPPPPPMTMAPSMLPPAPPAAMATGGPPAPVGLDLPMDVGSGPLTSDMQQTDESGNFFGWLKGTVTGSDLFSKVAEKAKSSMDSMITTLDPQMKDYMRSSGAVEIAIASDKEWTILGVKEGFQRQFTQVAARGLGAPGSATASAVAIQPLGYINGKKAALERINSLRQSGLVSPQATIVAVENFVSQMDADCWFDVCLVLLDDPAMDKKLEVLSQAMPIPEHAVACMQKHTPPDYRWRDSGFAVTVGQAVAESFGATPTEWHGWIGGTSTTEIIRNAAASLAYMYKYQKPNEYVSAIPAQ